MLHDPPFLEGFQNVESKLPHLLQLATSNPHPSPAQRISLPTSSLQLASLPLLLLPSLDPPSLTFLLRDSFTTPYQTPTLL